MRVAIPSVLQAYTDGVSLVEANGATLGELLADLDGRYPGIRFRMVNEAGALRPHVRLFVNREPVGELDRSLAPDDEVVILQALSGG
jgi:sulfur-carrier protein